MEPPRFTVATLSVFLPNSISHPGVLLLAESFLYSLNPVVCHVVRSVDLRLCVFGRGGALPRGVE